jgi:hypothetical protein
MDEAAESPLIRSFERHLRAENRSGRTIATLWVPESRSWVLSWDFVGQAVGPHDRRMTLRLL